MFYLLVILAVLSRLLPHPPNFACIGALGLFAGCYMRGRIAPVVPLAAMLVSDILGHVLRIEGMGFYTPVTMASVYAGFAVSALLGRQLQSRRSVGRVGLAAVGASVSFFLISNFGVWASGAYTLSVSGLVACYAAAVPFFGYTLAGDLIYSAALFGSFELVRTKLPERFWGGRVIARS